jgi:hypothetical protein
MKVEEVVGLNVMMNLSHVELLLCSAYPFRSAEITMCKMSATQKIFVQHFSESVSHRWPIASAHALALEKRTHTLYYKCWHTPCYNYFVVIL